jgi:hypothetical protein
MCRSGRCEKLVWVSSSIRLMLYVLVVPTTFTADKDLHVGCFQISDYAVIDAEHCA